MTGRGWVGAASTLHLGNQVPRRCIEFLHHRLLAYQGHCVHLPWILSSGAFVSRLGRVQAGVRPSCRPWQNSWVWCWFISLYGVSLWYLPWRMIRHSSHRLSSELGTDESYLPICTNKISKSTWLGSLRCHMTWDLHRSSLLSLIHLQPECLFPYSGCHLLSISAFITDLYAGPGKVPHLDCDQRGHGYLWCPYV